MAEGMDGIFFDAAGVDDGFDGGLGAAAIHVGGRLPNRVKRSAGIGKQQIRVPVPGP